MARKEISVRSWLAWASLAAAVIGGCASREAWIGERVGDMLGGVPLFIAWGVWVAVAGTLVKDLADGIPDLKAIFMTLLLPSISAPLGDGVVSWLVNWPFVWINNYVGSHLDVLFGETGEMEITGLAGLAWFVALFAAFMYWWANRRAGGGGRPNVGAQAGAMRR